MTVEGGSDARCAMHTNGGTTRFQILALYKFVAPKFQQDQLESLQKKLETKCRRASALGCLLLAPEGINGTISYPEGQSDLLQFFKANFPGLRCRVSFDTLPVFNRLNIKIKQQIVTLSQTNVDPTRVVGTYVKPGSEWNRLLRDPDCMVIDTRNEYEVRLGTFVNAVNPHTSNFKEFPNWLEQTRHQDFKSIAMFCTGGIRCEKATSLALSSPKLQDVPVYHLEGGILGYLDQVPQGESLFEGECYVFDQRVAVTHGLIPSKKYTQCHACRIPLSLEDMKRDDYHYGLSCRYCIDTITDKKIQRCRDRQRQIELGHQQGTLHVYDPKESL